MLHASEICAAIVSWVSFHLLGTFLPRQAKTKDLLIGRRPTSHHNTSFWWLPFGQSNTACSAALNKRSGVLCFIRNRRAATVSPRPQVPLIIFPGRTALRPTIRDEQHATPSACSEAWRCLPARAQTAGAMGTSASRAAGWLDPHPPRERRRISPQTRPISPTRPPVRRPRATRGRLPRRAARAHVSRTA
jgi:hypothetical protein